MWLAEATGGAAGPHAGSGGETAPNTSTEKVGLFYASCMDTAATEAAGMTPIKPELARIAAVATPAEFRHEAAHLQSMRGNILFGVASQQDLKDSRQVVLQLSQGGLGLPDRARVPGIRGDPRSCSRLLPGPHR